MDSTACILKHIFIKQAVTRDALMSLKMGASESFYVRTDNEGNMQYIAKINKNILRAINRAKEKEYIEEHKQTNRFGNRSYTFYYYTITGAGVRYLKDHCDKDDAEHPWLAYVKCDESKKISNRADAGEALSRMLEIAETAVFCEAAGASMPLDIFDRDTSIEELIGKEVSGKLKQGESLWDAVFPNEGKNYMEKNSEQGKDKIRRNKIQTNRSIIERARVQYISAELERINREGDENPKFTFKDLMHPGNPISGNPDDENYIRFVNDKSVKYSIAASKELSCCHDINRANIVALLQSKNKILFIKNTHKPDFIWSKTAETGEENLWHIWLNLLEDKYRKSSRDAGLCGALIVQNSRRFAKIFEGLTGSGYVSHAKIGEGYKHFYILPTNHDGAENLREIMTVSHERYYYDAKVRALNKGNYSVNTDEFAYAFPLRYKENGQFVYVALGYFIDTLQLYNIREAMKKLTCSAYIVCHSWQIPYYNAVLKGVECLPYADKKEEL